MGSPHGSFIWYELLTSDHGQAKRFYDAVAGWDIEPQPSAPGGMDYRMIRTGAGNTGGVMQLSDEMRSHGARPTWLGYIGVDDVDVAVRQAEAAGGRALMPAFDVPDVGQIAMLADPQGAPFYVMRPSSEGSSNAFSPTTMGHGAWNELLTTDLAAAKDFYLPLFGWELGDAMPMGPMGDYQFINCGGQTIGAMFAPGDPNPAWRFCFRTESLERSIDALKSGGGELLAGPMEVPGGDHIIQAKDPDGVFFMLVEGGQK